MTAAELQQLVRHATTAPGASEALANMPSGAAETLLWLQSPPDARQLARADLAREGQFEALGAVHALGEPLLWRDNPSTDARWLAAVHELPMLLDLAQAWSARREPTDLVAWTRIAHSWLASMGTGELDAADAQVEARRIEHCVTALVVLRAGGGLRQLPANLVLRLVDRVAGEVEYLLSRLKQAGGNRSYQLYAVYLATALLGPCLAARSRTRAAAQAAQAREQLAASLLADFGADGVHRALAPHAHRATLQTALSFVALARALDHALPYALHRRLRAALEFSLWTTLPDGGMPLAQDAHGASNRPLLALGAALYLLPHLDHVATHGRRGEAPEPLGRHFAQSGYVALRDGWHDESQAQHLFCDAPLPGAGPRDEILSVSFSIGGRQVLVDPGRLAAGPSADQAPGAQPRAHRSGGGNTVSLDTLAARRAPPPARGAGLQRRERGLSLPPAPALDLPQPLVRLGTRSALLRATVATPDRGAAHTRCVAYVMRQYVLLVDRVHATDGAEHDACFALQFAAGWQDRIVEEDDGGRGALLRGVSHRPSSDWRLLLDAPGARVHLGSDWLPRPHDGREPAPCLRAARTFRDEAFFACAIAPHVGGCTVHTLDARHGAGRSVLTVTGESAGRFFTDRLVVHWEERGLLIRPDYHARAGLALERRVDGALDHLMLAETAEWFTSLRPVHASRVPDAAGDLEW